jgi:hypothetical protein
MSHISRYLISKTSLKDPVELIIAALIEGNGRRKNWE